MNGVSPVGRKFKCDGVRPACGKCTERNVAANCQYDELVKRRGPGRKKKKEGSAVKRSTSNRTLQTSSSQSSIGAGSQLSPSHTSSSIPLEGSVIAEEPMAHVIPESDAREQSTLMQPPPLSLPLYPSPYYPPQRSHSRHSPFVTLLTPAGQNVGTGSMTHHGMDGVYLDATGQPQWMLQPRPRFQEGEDPGGRWPPTSR